MLLSTDALPKKRDSTPSSFWILSAEHGAIAAVGRVLHGSMRRLDLRVPRDLADLAGDGRPGTATTAGRGWKEPIRGPKWIWFEHLANTNTYIYIYIYIIDAT